MKLNFLTTIRDKFVNKVNSIHHPNSTMPEECDEKEIVTDRETLLWAIKSPSDYSSDEPTLFTFNDIQIVYDNYTKVYTLAIANYRSFNSRKDEVRFLKRMLSELTIYMQDAGYNTDKEFQFAFTNSTWLMKFESTDIEDLYLKFKIFVLGFAKLYG